MVSEDKKYSLSELEELVGEEQESSWFNFQNIYSTLIINWQWFALSMFICLCGALIYLRYTSPTYRMSARMLIKEEDNRTRRSSQMLANMQDFGFMTNSTGIDNEMEVLQSRTLIREVVKDLKLYVSYRAQGKIKETEIYGSQPINVDLDPTSLDSLDKVLLTELRAINLKLTRNGKNYLVEGKLTRDNKELDAFRKTFSALPATIRTYYGTLTLTWNGKFQMDDRDELLVSILPPMMVATRYLGSMSVEPTSKMTSVAKITVQDGDVLRGLDFLRQLAVCYNRQANADKNEISLRTEEFINERIEKINSELGTTEDALENFKKRNAVTKLEMDATQSLQMSSQYASRLAEANSQIQLLDYLREFVDNPANQYKIIPSNVGMTDQASTALITNYNQRVLDRNRLLQSASEQAPQVMTITTTLDEMQNSIRTALLQARRSADIQRQGIQSEYVKYQGRIGSTPEKERILNEIGRQQEVKSGLYLMLLQKREENSISLAATADNGKLIDDPLFEGKVSPKSSVIMLASLVLGFAVPAAVLFLLAFFRYRIEGREDLESRTTLPIVADIPVASDNVKTAAGIVVQANKNNQIDEIFRSLRTNVQFMMKENEKLILFTSATSGEGKTFLAANLAVSFALLGKKVILCGLDIRKPALGKLFNTSNRTVGVTNVLVKDKVTREFLNTQILKSGVNENLDLLLAGPTPPNPTELLARQNLKDILDILEDEYDYVILDTAPIGLVSDTLQIAKFANVCCFVCRADYTPKSEIGMVNTLSESGKLPNTCIVLNGVDMSKKKNGYYYGYGRYGKYSRYGYSRYGKYSRYGYGNYGNYGNYGQYAESHYGNKDDDSIKK